jgi:hypothetical protein
VARKYHACFKPFFPALTDRPGDLVTAERPGSVPKKSQSVGIFVLPDNSMQGVLEHLILECGEVVYPELVERARQYVSAFGEGERKRAKWRPFSEPKAVVASVSSLLKPGKTNTSSISDNRWIGEETRSSPKLAALLAFLFQLMPAPVTDVMAS